MPQVVASYQVSAFTTPTNSTADDADQVRGNDNTLRASINSHDGDAGIHFQGSSLATRPVAGTAGRKWMTTDDRRVWYDDGSSWQEIGYANLNGSTFTGLVSATSFRGTQVTTFYSRPDATGSVTLAGGTGSSDGATVTLYGNSASAGSRGQVAFLGGQPGSPTGDDGCILFLTAGNQRWKIDRSGHLLPFVTNTVDLGISSTGIRTVYVGTSYKVANVQVVTTRQTSWTAATGVATRTTFATGSVTLSQLAERVKALIDDLMTHGLIGL